MSAISKSAADRVGDARTYFLGWWIPKGAIMATLFTSVALRAVVWTVALVWMGVACIERAAPRTNSLSLHRPLYLFVTIAPVVLLTFGVVQSDFYRWLAQPRSLSLAAGLFGRATERGSGENSRSPEMSVFGGRFNRSTNTPS